VILAFFAYIIFVITCINFHVFVHQHSTVGPLDLGVTWLFQILQMQVFTWLCGGLLNYFTITVHQKCLCQPEWLTTFSFSSAKYRLLCSTYRYLQLIILEIILAMLQQLCMFFSWCLCWIY